MIRSLALVLTLLAGCAIGSPSTPTGTLVPTCDPIGDGTLTVVNADGSIRATSKGVSPVDGAIALNVCDGPVVRTEFVEGMRLGSAKNHQAGVFVDAHNTVVRLEHIVGVTSTTGITPAGLIGVTVTCAENVGSCDPAVPTPDPVVAAPAAPTPAPKATPTPAVKPTPAAPPPVATPTPVPPPATPPV